MKREKNERERERKKAGDGESTLASFLPPRCRAVMSQHGRVSCEATDTLSL